jgi:hypothetical protein
LFSGISLALALDNTVLEANGNQQTIFTAQTAKVFGMIGGIAFLTLCVNATLAGPILRKLGLADTSQVRKRVVATIEKGIRLHLIDKMVRLLTETRFSLVNFAVIRCHVPILADLTSHEILASAKRYQKANEHKLSYKAPSLRNVMPYLKGGDDEEYQVEVINEALDSLAETPDEETRAKLRHTITKPKSGLTTQEMRRVFIESLKAEYAYQVESGELAGHEFLYYALSTSLDFATDAINRDPSQPLNDWKFTTVVKLPASRGANLCYHQVACWNSTREDLEKADARFDVERVLAFHRGHSSTRQTLDEQFAGADEAIASAWKIVRDESMDECRQAVDLVKEFPMNELKAVASHVYVRTSV